MVGWTTTELQNNIRTGSSLFDTGCSVPPLNLPREYFGIFDPDPVLVCADSRESRFHPDRISAGHEGRESDML